MFLFFQQLKINPANGTDDLAFFIIVSIPFLIICIPFAYAKYKKGHRITYWENGILPKNFNYSRRNHVEILIAFGCLISFREDERILRHKLSLIQKYLDANFSDVNFNLKDSYEGALLNGLSTRRLVSWTNKYLKTSDKVELFSYVVHLANSNGSISSRESEMIFYLLREFNLNLDELNTELQDLLTQRKQSVVSSQRIDYVPYYYILGLENGASLLQIKRAYRKLVKIYHPDRIKDSDDLTRKKHVSQFIEIQEAYELLTSTFK
ncbi:J domain-containing protein [Fluviicola sp.]|uniref:J domain-containing protein n=1 Tax=Fluviicola sp. TaxID=1917219 RepID=UPI002606F520|nr:J domain-containing protein [Fluviicola sp.]